MCAWPTIDRSSLLFPLFCHHEAELFVSFWVFEVACTQKAKPAKRLLTHMFHALLLSSLLVAVRQCKRERDKDVPACLSACVRDCIQSQCEREECSQERIDEFPEKASAGECMCVIA